MSLLYKGADKNKAFDLLSFRSASCAAEISEATATTSVYIRLECVRIGGAFVQIRDSAMNFNERRGKCINRRTHCA